MPSGPTALALSTFRKNHPKFRISDRVVNGEVRQSFMVRKRDASRAVPQDPCNCTIAQACKSQTGVKDAFITPHVAYLLQQCKEGGYEVAKFDHNGAPTVRMIDTYGEAAWNTIITLRPPRSSHRVGAQTNEQKKNPRNGKRKPQSKATIQKRRETMAKNPSRFRLQANYELSGK